MKIAIDVDNTITDTFSKMIEYCELYNKNELKRVIKRNGVGSSQQMYGWTDKEQIEFAVKYFPKYALDLELKENARDIINKMGNNYEIHILTARTEALNPSIKGLTKKYLDNKNIKYNFLVTDCMNKGEYCRDNKIDILIDDEPKNILSAIDYVPVIMLNNELNQNFEIKNCYRCYNWISIEKTILSLQKNS